MPPGEPLSDHFRLREFACHDGSATPIEAAARLRYLCAMVLEPLRLAWGGPLVIVSGWRSPVHNLRVGGALESFHLLGDAADIAPVDLDRVDELHTVIQRMVRQGLRLPVGGLGLYPNWVHVDVRPRRANGTIATWMGKGLGSEVA
jgi:uncharacterized protein YcbK (DUF882 family)